MGAATNAERLARAVRNPGRLILAPTSVSEADRSVFFGGTSLGFHTDAEIDIQAEYERRHAPANGLLAEVARRSAERLSLFCFLEGPWDEDAIDRIFSKVTAAGSLAVLSPAESRIEGDYLPAGVSVGPPVLFAADDPQHKSVYIPRPAWLLSFKRSVALAIQFGAGLPVLLEPTLPANGVRPFQVARLENINLS